MLISAAERLDRVDGRSLAVQGTVHPPWLCLYFPGISMPPFYKDNIDLFGRLPFSIPLQTTSSHVRFLRISINLTA